ncbi:MAG: signal recognition particle-docking protein FtsY [Actinobacteria bacterium]|nr:MAG: signal recognition particle-docking protein FtsY [Actinomycetota bacterium]TMK46291.1 MAG: signal recognition particle-docking protein FtsY [Actinomycetota bacterium]TMK65795.1 MAG: signal recognition particle-docking protein FtsY [Actinomycetota bacterium]
MPAAEAPSPARRRSDGLGARARALLTGGTPGGDEWNRLEDLLLKADVGPAAASRMVRDIRDRYEVGADPEDLLREEIVGLLGEDGALRLPSGRLGVVLVVGVNGAGKTTTIGKLAARLAREGRKVSVANTDTFRAAAAEQLDAWARRANVQLIAQQRGADPGAVAFDAVESARARDVDVLLVDTAGRLHTRTPLMDELQKVKRVLEKAAGTVDEVLLVLDATTGQNGIAQAEAFASAVDVTGVALAKLDGTAKGGIVLAVREGLGVPVKLVGTGERIDDLQAFDSRAFAERILGG